MQFVNKLCVYCVEIYTFIIASRIVTGDRIAWLRSKQVEKRELF